MADHSVGTRDEWHESKASQAWWFVLKFRKVLLQLHCRFGPFWFPLRTCFCVLECYQKGVKSSTAENVFFVLVSLFAPGGKIDKGKEFTTPKGTVYYKFVCYIQGLQMYNHVGRWLCKRSQCFCCFQRHSVVQSCICFLWFHGRWTWTTSSFEIEDIFQEELFFTLGKV